MDAKNRLVNALEQISKRYNSIFFSKLVLLERESEPEVSYIRHYDIECEAVQTLADTLNTKIKSIKFRSFYLIKFFRKDEVFRRKPRTHNVSFGHNYSTSSFHLPSYTRRSMKDELKFAKTSRNQDNHGTGFDKTS